MNFFQRIPKTRLGGVAALAAAAVLATVVACTSRSGTGGGTVPPPKPVDPPQLAPTRAALAVTPEVLAADGFTTSVRPVLVAHCTPCHEPGGKMYDRLPFDRAETIASHREGVLRRLKGDDRAAVEKWLETLPAAATETASRAR
jgi:hypothetical protein